MGLVVLQYGGLEGWLAWGKAVSRYKFCIVTVGLDWLGERVCHDTIYYIVTREPLWACIRLGSCVAIQEIVL